MLIKELLEMQVFGSQCVVHIAPETPDDATTLGQANIKRLAIALGERDDQIKRVSFSRDRTEITAIVNGKVADVRKKLEYMKGPAGYTISVEAA